MEGVPDGTSITQLARPILRHFYFYLFLGPHLWHMKALRLGVELELQLPAYTTATATPDRAMSVTHATYGHTGSLTH